MDELLVCIVTIVVCIIASLFLIFGIYFAGSLIDQTHCVASINGEVFAEEPGWNIDCESKGDSTQCTIYTGSRFTRFPARHIVNKNIVIDCKLK